MQTYSAQKANHCEHGLRFMQLVQSLDNILGSYDRKVPTKSCARFFPPKPKYTIHGDVFDFAIPYLKIHLREWVRGHCGNRLQSTRSPAWCIPLVTPTGSLSTQDDAMRPLPKAIVRKLIATHQVWQADRVTVTWIVCYLERRLPDTSVIGWERFGCSHRCISGGTGKQMVCLSSNHLIWESMAANISRGYGYMLCWQDCNHCGLKLCVCQGLHKPPCL
jgi:hypothetical protein